MIQNMKVTIATGLYPPEIGGPATYAAMLEAELPAHGIAVTVVPFRLVRQSPKVIRHVVYAWKLWQKSRQADVVYALDPTSVGLPALLVARLRRKPFLLRVPGDYAWEQGQLRFGVKDTLHDFIEKRYSYGLFVSMLCWLESAVARRARFVIVPSTYMKAVVAKWGVDHQNIVVIYSVLFPLEVADTKENIRNDLAHTYPMILSAGRLVPNKGFVELIKVLARLKRAYPQAQLVIAGDGPGREDLQRVAAEEGVSGSVRLVGQLSKEALGAAIKAADVFVLNTAHEGLSHQLIEVMDIGTPIVTTKVGGNPELITDGVHGFLVPYNDTTALVEATTRVLEHPESRERMVQTARLRSKDFTKEKVVGEMILLFTTFKD
jgi:glycosyltransferase involved in cell wall biosynthesis